MANIFNDDFRDFIFALNKHDVEYILVGGYAVILHGYRRSTGDMDVWINRTENNYLKLAKAFFEFGLPLHEMKPERFLNANETDVFSFGRPPVSIEILTQLKGVDFNGAFERSKIIEEEGLKIRLIHFNDLITAKKAAGRYRDLDDIEKLTKQ